MKNSSNYERSHEGDPIEISIIIPAYNEERRVRNAMAGIVSFFSNLELIVVCDGIDNTANIVKEFMISYPQVKLVEFNEKLGKGQGIMEGMKIARGDKIGFVDADESVHPNDVKKMFDALSAADGVIASRRLKDSRILIKQPLKRGFASRVFNILVRLIFGLNFKDTQCGAKVFRKEAIKDVFSELKTKGFEFDVELLWRLKMKGYKVVEFPITWKHSEGSSFSLSNAPNMFFSLLKVRLWK